MTIKTQQIIYYFRATCLESLESSSGPLTNWPKTI